MAPINNQGSSLRTTTVFGDKVYENEDYLSDQYNARNTAPVSKKQMQSPGTAKVWGREQPEYVEQLREAGMVEEFEMDDAMHKAIAEDLASKGLPAKPKSKKKTTVQSTARTTKKTTD